MQLNSFCELHNITCRVFTAIEICFILHQLRSTHWWLVSLINNRLINTIMYDYGQCTRPRLNFKVSCKFRSYLLLCGEHEISTLSINDALLDSRSRNQTLLQLIDDVRRRSRMSDKHIPVCLVVIHHPTTVEISRLFRPSAFAITLTVFYRLVQATHNTDVATGALESWLWYALKNSVFVTKYNTAKLMLFHLSVSSFECVAFFVSNWASLAMFVHCCMAVDNVFLNSSQNVKIL